MWLWRWVCVATCRGVTAALVVPPAKRGRFNRRGSGRSSGSGGRSKGARSASAASARSADEVGARASPSPDNGPLDLGLVGNKPPSGKKVCAHTAGAFACCRCVHRHRGIDCDRQGAGGAGSGAGAGGEGKEDYYEQRYAMALVVSTSCVLILSNRATRILKPLPQFESNPQLRELAAIVSRYVCVG